MLEFRYRKASCSERECNRTWCSNHRLFSIYYTMTLRRDRFRQPKLKKKNGPATPACLSIDGARLSQPRRGVFSLELLPPLLLLCTMCGSIRHILRATGHTACCMHVVSEKKNRPVKIRFRKPQLFCRIACAPPPPPPPPIRGSAAQQAQLPYVLIAACDRSPLCTALTG